MRKTISKLIATASAISMLASVAAVSASALGEDSASKPYDLSYVKIGTDSSVLYATGAEGIKEVEIPATFDDAGKEYTVTGVVDFAFADMDLDVIAVPDTLATDYVSAVAFLTKADINAYLEKVLSVTEEDFTDALKEYAGIDANGDGEITEEDVNNAVLSATAKKVLAFAANTVEFMGKKDWKGNEEELTPAVEVLGNVYNTVCEMTDKNLNVASFIVELYDLADAESLQQVIRTDEEKTTEKMSAQSYNNFLKWVETIPFDNLTLKGSDGIPMQEYAKTNEIRGLKYEVAESCILGDANHDGVFNIRDAAYVAKKLANQQGDELHLPCADFNKDGVANIRDAAAMARELAKLK